MKRRHEKQRREKGEGERGMEFFTTLMLWIIVLEFITFLIICIFERHDLSF